MSDTSSDSEPMSVDDFDRSAHSPATGNTQFESSSGSEKTMSMTPPKAAKKIMRMFHFQKSWRTTYTYITPVTGNIYRANCTLCKRDFGIGHGGEGDIKTHMASKSHKQAERVTKQNNIMTKFLSSSKTPDCRMM